MPTVADNTHSKPLSGSDARRELVAVVRLREVSPAFRTALGRCAFAPEIAEK